MRSLPHLLTTGLTWSRRFRGGAHWAGWLVSAGLAPVLAPLNPGGFAAAATVVVAPHPDDESLAVTTAFNDPAIDTYVVVLTPGDANIDSAEPSSPPRTGGIDFPAHGRHRVEELRQAVAALGLPEDHLSVLGYPDGQLRYLRRAPDNQICMRYMSICETYLRIIPKAGPLRRALRSSRSAGTRAVPFSARHLQRDLCAIQDEIRPQRVFLPHPGDSHIDHAATFRLVEDALQDCPGDGGTRFLAYLIHFNDIYDSTTGLSREQIEAVPDGARDWPFHAGWAGDPARAIPLEPPIRRHLPNPYRFYDAANGPDTHIDREPLPPPTDVVELSPTELERKAAALARYESQMRISRTFMTSFLTSTEIFWCYTWDPHTESLVATREPCLSSEPGGREKADG